MADLTCRSCEHDRVGDRCAAGQYEPGSDEAEDAKTADLGRCVMEDAKSFVLMVENAVTGLLRDSRAISERVGACG